MMIGVIQGLHSCQKEAIPPPCISLFLLGFLSYILQEIKGPCLRKVRHTRSR